MVTTDARLIALDWGTSSLRAWLLDADGAVLDERATKQGVMQVTDGDFAGTYDTLVSDWTAAHGPLPALACGMIGSRGGWAEAAYVDTPADPATLAEQLTEITTDHGPLSIVPGVMQRGGDGRLADVMRGEETQVLGALASRPELAEDSWLVLPGTHAKWVAVRDGHLSSFTTYMTGELYAVLSEHSILGRPAAEAGDSQDDEAFTLGITTARDTGDAGGVSALFSARSRMLAGELAAGATLSYLSGLLIGEELRSVFATGQTRPALCLIGDEALCVRYRAALACFDLADVTTLADAARLGLWQIACAAGLLDKD